MVGAFINIMKKTLDFNFNLFKLLNRMDTQKHGKKRSCPLNRMDTQKHGKKEKLSIKKASLYLLVNFKFEKKLVVN